MCFSIDYFIKLRKIEEKKTAFLEIVFSVIKMYLWWYLTKIHSISRFTPQTNIEKRYMGIARWYGMDRSLVWTNFQTF